MRSWVAPYLDEHEGIAVAVLGQVRNVVQGGLARSYPGSATMICLVESKLIVASAETVIAVPWVLVPEWSLDGAVLRVWYLSPPALSDLDYVELELDARALSKQPLFVPVLEKCIENNWNAMGEDLQRTIWALRDVIRARGNRQISDTEADQKIGEILAAAATDNAQNSRGPGVEGSLNSPRVRSKRRG